MTTRRILLTVVGVTMALVTSLFNPVPASAQLSATSQDTPSTIWTQPGAPGDLIEGVGTWVYVAPQTPGPAQQPDSYAYSLSFMYPGEQLGFISLATGPEGKTARLSLTTIVEVPYNWVPGRFYFLYVHHLQDGFWGGWVMDWEAGVWSYIGSVQAPADYGLLSRSSRTRVWWPGSNTHPGSCAGYPRTDAYFFPTIGYRGSTFTIGTLDFHHLQPGACGSQTEILDNGWVHYRLGADPS